MKLLPCAVRGVLAGLMISIGGYVYLGCENRVVGAVFFTWLADRPVPCWPCVRPA